MMNPSIPYAMGYMNVCLAAIVPSWSAHVVSMMISALIPVGCNMIVLFGVVSTPPVLEGQASQNW